MSRAFHPASRLIAPAAVLFTGAGTALAQSPSVDPLLYSGPAWSPYLVGVGIGLLVLLTLYFSKKPVGASSAYAAAAGLIGRAVAPRHVASLKYYQDHKPAVDWTLLFVIGAMIGAFLAAWSGGEITGRWLPPMWEARFGEGTLGLRVTIACLGGIVMAFGARLAGGCTSGHGISGTLQLSVGSWIAVLCFFAGGVATAMLLYRL